MDRELAVALADELSDANAGASPPAADCPDGARGASLPVRDGAVRGTVSAVIAPVGTTGPSPDPGDAYASARTSGGEELYVISRAEDDSSANPFERDLPSIAERLAARF
ncbi:MAG: hypothetical protein HOV94_35145 [Saccharothrix sp.]|nr:hypothetical protein [Saccharothrix sp.]